MWSLKGHGRQQIFYHRCIMCIYGNSRILWNWIAQARFFFCVQFLKRRYMTHFFEKNKVMRELSWNTADLTFSTTSWGLWWFNIPTRWNPTVQSQHGNSWMTHYLNIGFQDLQILPHAISSCGNMWKTVFWFHNYFVTQTSSKTTAQISSSSFSQQHYLVGWI